MATRVRARCPRRGERLPRTFAALAAGQIHPVHVKIIEDVTRVLSAEDAARADEILASWQHVEQRALDLRAAGMPGTLRELRVRAYLDLLQERDSRMIAGAPDPAAGGTTEQAGEAPDTGGPGAPAGTGGAPAGTGGAPAGTGGVRPAPADPGPSVAALVNITVPLAAMEADPWRTPAGRHYVTQPTVYPA